MDDWKKHYDSTKKAFPKLGGAKLAKMAMITYKGNKGAGSSLRDEHHGNVQAVIFEKKKWSLKDSEKWLNEHNFHPKKAARDTKNFIRYRIKTPIHSHDVYIFTKPLTGKDDGVKLVIEGNESHGGYMASNPPLVGQVHPLVGGYMASNPPLVGQMYEQKGGWVPTVNSLESVENTSRYQLAPQGNSYAVDFAKWTPVSMGIDMPPVRDLGPPPIHVSRVHEVRETVAPPGIVSNERLLGMGTVRTHGGPVYGMIPQKLLGQGMKGGLYRDPGFHGPDPSGQSGRRPLAVFY